MLAAASARRSSRRDTDVTTTSASCSRESSARSADATGWVGAAIAGADRATSSAKVRRWRAAARIAPPARGQCATWPIVLLLPRVIEATADATARTRFWPRIHARGAARLRSAVHVQQRVDYSEFPHL